MTEGSLIELGIDSLAYQGAGVGRHEGVVCFVPLTAPGDRIRARVTEARKGFSRAELVEVIDPSAHRTTPRCPHFGVCGGCDWQHVDYPTQLAAKTDIVTDNLKRISRIEFSVAATVASPNAYGYRNRVRLHVASDGKMGYFRRGTHDLVSVDSCPLLDDRLDTALSDPDLRATAVGTASVRGSGAKEVELLLQDEKPVVVGERAVFGQVNAKVNALLVPILREAVLPHLPPRPRIVDLFCGDGNLSLPLADKASEIFGYDLSAQAVRMAGRRAKEAGHSHCRYQRGPVNATLMDRIKSRRADLLILDPPRIGLKGIAARVAALGAAVVAYVSCVPPILARDLKVFTDLGYRPTLIQPLDMFPQTFHVEVLTVLVRGPAST